MATSRSVSNTPFACDRYGFHDGFAFEPQVLAKRVVGHDIGEVALVKLQNVRNGIELELVFLQVLFQIFERFQIGVQPFLLRISDKNYPVGAFQDQFAAGFVEDLPWHCVQVQASFETANGSEIERKKIKKKRAVGFVASEIILPFRPDPVLS